MNRGDRILLILHALGESYGLDIVRGSAGKIGRGSIYVHLTRLQDAGLVSSRYVTCGPRDEGVFADDTGPQRRVFSLTASGTAAALKLGACP